MPQSASEIANIVNQYNTEWRNKRLQEMKQIEAEISRNPLMHKTFEPRILELTKQLGMGEFEPFFRPTPGAVMAAEQLQKSAEEGGYQGRAFYGQPGTPPPTAGPPTAVPGAPKTVGGHGPSAVAPQGVPGAPVTPAAPTGPPSMQELFRKNPVAMGISQPGSIDDLVKMMQAQAGQSTATAALAAAMGGGDKERNDWIQKQQKNYEDQYALDSGDALTQAQMDYDRLISGAPPGGEFRPFPGSTQAGGEGRELVPARRLPPSVTPKAQMGIHKATTELNMSAAALQDQFTRTGLINKAGQRDVVKMISNIYGEKTRFSKLPVEDQRAISNQLLITAFMNPDAFKNEQGNWLPVEFPVFNHLTKDWEWKSLSNIMAKQAEQSLEESVSQSLVGGQR